MGAYDAEPTPADLAAIEDEWPVIEADLTVLDAEITVITAPGGPSPLDWRRLRHAHRQRLTAIAHRAAVSYSASTANPLDGAA